MDVRRDDAPGGYSHTPGQAEFIRMLGDLVRGGDARKLQEAALTLWRVYPKISLTFARRLIAALKRLDVPAQCFDASLLVILARCYLICGQAEKACEHLAAAHRIIAPDASYALVCLIGELEVNARLVRSQLGAAHVAYQRLEHSSQHVGGGLSSEQLLLGVRLSFAQGDLSQAAGRAARAVEQARDDEQRCRAQLAALRIDEYIEGDIRGELIQLITLEHSQHIRSRDPLSAETRSQLSYRLMRAFLSQGKFNQAMLHLHKARAQTVWPFDTPEPEAVVLALASGHPDKARRHFELLAQQSMDGLAQAERLEWQLRALVASQVLNGARDTLVEAEELFRLCEAIAHAPLCQRARLLLASTLIATGDHERARRLLQESGLRTDTHKALYLTHGCLFALCGAEDKLSGIGASGSSLGYLANLLADEDTAAVILFLVRLHPDLIKLLVLQGLEGALSPPVRRQLGSRLAAVQRVCREHLSGSHPPPTKRLPDGAEEPGLSLVSGCRQSSMLQRDPPSYEQASAYEGCPEPDHTLHIQLFGSLQVRRQSACLDLEHLRRSKVRDLIVILAIARGREISRELIIGELWPQQSVASSMNSFYVVWNALKTVCLSDGPKISARFCTPERFPFSNAGGRCCLLTDYCSLDLNEFDRLVRGIRSAAQQGQSEHCFRFAEELMTVYRDEMLPADLENERIDRVRLHYQKTFVEMMLMVARLALMRRRAAVALPFIERGLAVGPSCEELYRLAMHAYALEGRRDDSLRAYYCCRKNLACELGIEPNEEINALFSQLISTAYPSSRQVLVSPRLLACAPAHMLEEATAEA